MFADLSNIITWYWSCCFSPAKLRYVTRVEGGELTALVCHPTKNVSNAEWLSLYKHWVNLSGISNKISFVKSLTIFFCHHTFKLQLLTYDFRLLLINHLINVASCLPFAYINPCVTLNKSVLYWTQVCQLLRYAS